MKQGTGNMGRREALQALGLLLAASTLPASAQPTPLRIGIIGTGRIGGGARHALDQGGSRSADLVASS